MIKEYDKKRFNIERLNSLFFNLYSIKDLSNNQIIKNYIIQNSSSFNFLKEERIIIFISLNFFTQTFYLFLLELILFLKNKNINFNKLIIVFDESAESKSILDIDKIKRKINEIKKIFYFKYLIITSNYYFYNTEDEEVVYFPYFFYYFQKFFCSFKKRKTIDVFNIFFKYKQKKKTFLFNSLNRVIRTHRLAFLYYLKQINFDNEYLLSFDKIFINSFFNNILEQDYLIDLNELIKIKTPIELDINDFKINQANNIGPFYMNTFFSQINETLADKHSIFLSEKVFKPIIRLSPFIVFGNPYTLQELNRWGFETNFIGIDNSYDNEINKLKRLKMILNQMKLLDLPKKDLLDFYYQNRNILIHNYDRYFNLNEKDILDKTNLKRIIDCYESL